MSTIKNIDELKFWQLRYIIRLYAFLQPPQKIKKLFLEVYNEKVDPDLLIKLNPDLKALCILEDQSVKYFHEIRGNLLENFLEIQIGDRLLRLEALQNLYNYYQSKKDLEKCQKLLEIAAMETGPIYEDINRFLGGEKGLPFVESGEA